LLVSK